METFSHREMRNNSAKILRAVAAGDSYTITNDGVDVAMLVPVARPAALPAAARPAVRRGGIGDLPRVRVAESTAEARYEFAPDPELVPDPEFDPVPEPVPEPDPVPEPLPC